MNTNKEIADILKKLYPTSKQKTILVKRNISVTLSVMPQQMERADFSQLPILLLQKLLGLLKTDLVYAAHSKIGY